MAIPEAVKNVSAILAVGISLIAYIPYIVDMLKGGCRPHAYTWITIFLVTISVAYTQVVGGAGTGAIPTIVGCFINGFILALCLIGYGTKDVERVDKICLAISVIGVASFLVLKDYEGLSLAIVATAEVTSFLPTFRKTKNDPYSESLPSYYLLLVKLTLILIAIENYNWLTVSYPVIWYFVFIPFLVLAHSWRKDNKPKLT